MKATLRSLTFLAVAFGVCPARAGDWIRLSTPQVELYSTNSEAQSRTLLDLLARAHSVLSRVSFVQDRIPQEVSQMPLRIIALSSKEEYAPFRLSPVAFGYFRHSRRGSSIVLQDIRPEHYPAAIHEYVHFVLRQAGLTLPLWLNEGVADFYSSLQIEGGQIRIGESLPSRLRWLEQQAPVDLALLFAFDSKSPLYTDPEKIHFFYAESWALVHMLAMSPDYERGFPRFISCVSQGLGSAAALSQVYGQSIAEVETALLAYLPSLPHFPGRVEKPDLHPILLAPAPFSYGGIQSEAVHEEALATLR